MKKFLITGFSGFVSRHFLDFLNSISKLGEIEVKGVDIHQPKFPMIYANMKCSFENINLLDLKNLKNVVKDFKPDYVLHLASFSSVAFSWENPVLSFKNNIDIFFNLVEALKDYTPHCRLLSIGSSEEYGSVSKEELPLVEDQHLLNPVSPYAVARVSQELLSKVYANGYGLDIIMTRSFNHIGPYQDNRFVIPSFAKQLQSIKKSEIKKGILYTGNVDVIRDFVDVRDVVSAYYNLFLRGRKGEIYNICSGTGSSLRIIINKMAAVLDLEITIEINKAFLRPNDNPIIVGSNTKLKKEINWNMNYSLDRTLKDILDYWDKE